jgi:N-acyl-D-amino-acid deacylase
MPPLLRNSFIILSLIFTFLAASFCAGSASESTRLKAAVAKGLQRAQAGAENYLKHRQCFSCHHQALPVMAMTRARARGLSIDEAALKKQVEFTAADFTRRRESVTKGQGVGGANTTIGYALMTLEAAQWKSDETTAAMVEFLLKQQKEDGRWQASANRPPSEGSNVTTTAVSVFGLRHFATAEQRERADAATERVRRWLLDAAATDVEDKVFRLWGLKWSGATKEQVQSAADALLAAQNADGGWAQLPDAKSDAYATGSALVALHEAGGIVVTNAAYQRGAKFLLETQNADGSWIVKTRSRPIQIFFDNGDPGGESQFISIEATCWATMALTLAVEK